jgi:hypothetical protein
LNFDSWAVKILPLSQISRHCWLLIIMFDYSFYSKNWCRYAKCKLYLKYLW